MKVSVIADMSRNAVMYARLGSGVYTCVHGDSQHPHQWCRRVHASQSDMMGITLQDRWLVSQCCRTSRHRG